MHSRARFYHERGSLPQYPCEIILLLLLILEAFPKTMQVQHTTAVFFSGLMTLSLGTKVSATTTV